MAPALMTPASTPGLVGQQSKKLVAMQICGPGAPHKPFPAEATQTPSYGSAAVTFATSHQRATSLRVIVPTARPQLVHVFAPSCADVRATAHARHPLVVEFATPLHSIDTLSTPLQYA
jgi:hypothetical protein